MKIRLAFSIDGFGSIILDTKYGDGLKNECFLNTNKFCFLCLSKIAHEEGDPPPPTQSLGWAELHLGMNFKNVLSQNGIINDNRDHPLSPQLNEKGVNFHATICSECASITEVLSVSCDPSGEIGNEHHDVVTTLTAIHHKMAKVNESERMDEFYQVVKIKPEQIEGAAWTSIGRNFRTAIIRSLQVYHDEEQQKSVILEQRPSNAITAIDRAEEVDPMMEDEDAIQEPQVEIEDDDHPQTLNVMGVEPPSTSMCNDGEHSAADNSVNEIEPHPIPSTSRAALRRSPRCYASLKRLASDPRPRNSSNITKQPMRKKPKIKKSEKKPRYKNNYSRTYLSKRDCRPSHQNGMSCTLETHESGSYHKTNLPCKKHLSPSPSANFAPRRWECIFCSVVCSGFSKLERHMLQHTTERPYPCPSCNYWFKRKDHMDVHMERIHNPDRVRTLPCDHCPKKFFANKDLKQHQATHGGNRPFHCGSCSLAFTTKNGLTDHQSWVHDREGAPLPCSLCEKSFVNRRKLQVHHLHAHKNDYRCEMCDQRFISKRGLRCHIRTHVPNTEKPFRCDCCGMGFFTRSDLDKHAGRHTTREERKFICGICELRFLKRSYLTGHLQRHESKGERLDNESE